MEYLKFLLSWVASVAWPLIVLVFILMYRRQLGSLLSHLSGIAERVRNEPVDIALGEKFRVKFGEAVKKVEKEAEKVLSKGTPGVDIPPFVAPAITGDAPRPPGGHLPPPPGFRDHFHTLADISSRAAILEAWTEVELAVQGLPDARREGGPPGSGAISVPVVVRQLAEKGTIDAGTFVIFEELRQLRNQAAHSSRFQPSADQAREYVDLALRLAARLRSLG